MAFTGFLMALVSIVFSIIALLPFLGWLNWFVAPFSFIGLIVSLLGLALGGKRALCAIETLLCSIVMIVSIVRLVTGAGF